MKVRIIVVRTSLLDIVWVNWAQRSFLDFATMVARMSGASDSRSTNTANRRAIPENAAAAYEGNGEVGNSRI